MKVKPDKTVRLLKILGKQGTLAILDLISNNPKRYNQLKITCASDKTLSFRLKELEENELISTISLKSEGRNRIFYQITQKGKEILEQIGRL